MTAPAVDPNAGLRAEIARLQRQVDRLDTEVRTLREQNLAHTAAHNYADSDAAGYIDRTGLEGP